MKTEYKNGTRVIALGDGYILPPQIEVDESGRLRRFFVKLGLAKPIIRSYDPMEGLRQQVQNLNKRGESSQ